MQTTTNTVTTGITKVNLPVGTKIESQSRPRVDKERLAAMKIAKDIQIKTSQIIKK